MLRSLKKFEDTFNFYRVSFNKRSVFYKLSLNKSPHLFDSNKFIDDPWIGDPRVGRDLLDCNLIPETGNDPLNIMEIFSSRNQKDSKYATSFVWIRDICAIGGSNNLKYGRNLISTFISSYKKRSKFWLDQESWDNAVVGERIVNWVFSYSSFASGASDKFQREVLSSIAEQFSHLLKCYKAEFNPYSKLMALKAILCGYCITKTDQPKRIQKIMNAIYTIISECVDTRGMFKNGSPIDHFQVFRSLLEIRLIAKNSGLNSLDNTFINDKLSQMASAVRFLRLCDGSISQCSGDSSRINSFFIPSRQMVDTALSLVEIKSYNDKPFGFDRLETKKATIVINTKPRDSRSKFNHLSKPGINIFDFEASFGIDKLLNRSDISAVFNGFHIKPDKSTRSFTKKSIRDDRPFFECEAQFSNRFFDFAVRREIELFLSKSQMKCMDLVLASEDMESYFRFVFNKAVDIKEINKKSALLSIDKSEYVFSITSGDAKEILIQQRSEVGYPTIEIFSPLKSQKEIEFSWSIECMR